jgi:NCAIR mutase (PurE)-related protein
VNDRELRRLLLDVKRGRVSLAEAAGRLRGPGFVDLGFARLDTARERRVGFPEVVLGRRKTPRQIAAIVQELTRHQSRVLVTHASEEAFEAVRAVTPRARYEAAARCIVHRTGRAPRPTGLTMIVTGGTSDIPVAEEARVTAELFDVRVETAYDCGVAGIHRLVHVLPRLRAARVVVVVAGMEGALASVVGGLVSSPVIAVPTSVGYGASFEGLSALLTMLNSCAAGISVVNIDNGFGAGYLAGLLHRREPARGGRR